LDFYFQPVMSRQSGQSELRRHLRAPSAARRDAWTSWSDVRLRPLRAAVRGAEAGQDHVLEMMVTQELGDPFRRRRCCRCRCASWTNIRPTAANRRFRVKVPKRFAYASQMWPSYGYGRTPYSRVKPGEPVLTVDEYLAWAATTCPGRKSSRSWLRERLRRPGAWGVAPCRSRPHRELVGSRRRRVWGSAKVLCAPDQGGCSRRAGC